jgi:hypothetical protein
MPTPAVIRFADVHRDRAESHLTAGDPAARELSRRSGQGAEAHARQLEQIAGLVDRRIEGPAQRRRGDAYRPWRGGRGGVEDRAVAAARPRRGGARDAAQAPPRPIAAQHGEGRGLAAFLRSDGRADRRPVADAAFEIGLRARDQRRRPAAAWAMSCRSARWRSARSILRSIGCSSSSRASRARWRGGI